MITYDFDQAAGMVRVILTGNFLLDDVKHFIRGINTHTDFHPGMNVLIDAHQASMAQLTSEDVVELGSYAQKFFPQRGNSNVAWVTKHDIDFGLIRMYELWHEAKLPGYVRVFRTIAEAETWLLNQPKKDSDRLPDP